MDMRPDMRADVEVAMQRGLAVVQYDCKSLRVLPNCSVAGDYAYAPVTRKTHTVKFSTADELEANLPATAKLLSTTLEADLKRGASIDVALDVVGKRQSRLQGAETGDLRGQCEGATHVVRAATIGAFVMKAGSQANARSSAELFGISGKASGEEQYEVFQSDGDPHACSSAEHSAGSPPSGCAALLRLDLLSILPAAVPGRKADVSQIVVDAPGCPAGFRWNGVKCASATTSDPYLCRAEDIPECTAQCNRGHAGSCNSLGFSYFDGRGVPLDRTRAAELFDRSCQGGDMYGCNNLGTAHLAGLGATRSPRLAVQFYERACEAEPKHCYNLGIVFRDGKNGVVNQVRAAELFSRSCYGGDPAGCSELGNAYSRGAGVNKDQTRATKLHRLACDGNRSSSCAAVGARFLNGTGTQINASKAFTYLNRACQKDDMTGCGLLGLLYYEGKGVASDRERGLKLMEQSCSSGGGEGCVILAVHHRQKGDESMASYYFEKACENGIDDHCAN